MKTLQIEDPNGDDLVIEIGEMRTGTPFRTMDTGEVGIVCSECGCGQHVNVLLASREEPGKWETVVFCGEELVAMIECKLVIAERKRTAGLPDSPRG